MERIVKISTSNCEADIRESAEYSMTIRDLIERLEEFSLDSKVVFYRNDRYSNVSYDMLTEVEVETFAEQEEREQRERKEEERLEMEMERRLGNAIRRIGLLIGDRFEFPENTFFVWNQFGRKIKSRLYAIDRDGEELVLFHIPVGKESEDDYEDELTRFEYNEVEKLLHIILHHSEMVLETEIEIYDGDKSLGMYDCECYDGYAICENIETGRYVSLTYPKKADIDYDTAMQILRHRGLYNVSAEDITYGDIMMHYGEIEKN